MMVMPVMKGGGAERVAALLMNEFHKSGCQVEFLLTSSSEEEVIRTELDEEIPLVLLQDKIKKNSNFKTKMLKLYSSIFCRMFEAFRRPVPSHFAYVSFVAQYENEIQTLREKMKSDPEMTVITFLQPAIPMVLLAARGLPNKIIFSERGNPERLMKHRYGKKFIEKYYTRADVAVFQTEDAKKQYPICIQEKGIIIPNLVKADLPQSYHGKKNKNITTFCRISLQKNLPMLVEAFAKLYQEYSEYKLRIIGDTLNKEGEEVKKSLVQQIRKDGLEEVVEFLPFSKNVHEKIIRDAMYVNSSDYEGISNAMLEAMAIGMPVVCTDCPVGGARSVIKDKENGLLVGVNDVEGMYLAMKEIIENTKLAEKLSTNASKLREQLSIQNIAKRWMDLI